MVASAYSSSHLSKHGTAPKSVIETSFSSHIIHKHVRCFNTFRFFSHPTKKHHIFYFRKKVMFWEQKTCHSDKWRTPQSKWKLLFLCHISEKSSIFSRLHKFHVHFLRALYLPDDKCDKDKTFKKKMGVISAAPQRRRAQTILPRTAKSN